MTRDEALDLLTRRIAAPGTYNEPYYEGGVREALTALTSPPAAEATCPCGSTHASHGTVLHRDCACPLCKPPAAPSAEATCVTCGCAHHGFVAGHVGAHGCRCQSCAPPPAASFEEAPKNWRDVMRSYQQRAEAAEAEAARVKGIIEKVKTLTEFDKREPVKGCPCSSCQLMRALADVKP